MGNLFYTPPVQTTYLRLKVYDPKDIVAKSAMHFAINQTKIRFTTISSITEVGAIGNSCPHYGVIFKNTFIVSGANTGNYTYLLVHALQNTKIQSVPPKVKLDFFFTNNLNDAKETLGQLVGVPSHKVESSNWEQVSSTATMSRVVAAFVKMMGNEFDYKCTDKMALQQYDDKINCIIAAKYLYATVMNIDVKNCIEEWMQSKRGMLLKMKRVDIDKVNNGIPCKGGDVFWITLNEQTTQKGIYRLQEKDNQKVEGKYLGHREKWSNEAIVHAKRFRIVFKQKGNDFAYGWKDIFRSNVKNDAQIEFNKLT